LRREQQPQADYLAFYDVFSRPRRPYGTNAALIDIRREVDISVPFERCRNLSLAVASEAIYMLGFGHFPKSAGKNGVVPPLSLYRPIQSPPPL